MRKYAGERFEVESAGLEPGTMNPLVVEVLREEGIDLGSKATRSAAELLRQGRRYDYVITVCGKEAAERCPVFPGAAGQARRLHWPFDDPSRATGSHQEKLAKVRRIRDQIKAAVLAFAAQEE